MKTLLIHALVFVISCIGLLVIQNEVMKGAFAGALASELLILVSELVERRRAFRYMIWSVLHFYPKVYISIAALVRIRHQGKYLLTYSNDNAQFHPIGGALHWSRDVKPPFPYTQVIKSTENKDDMRFEVEGLRLYKVIEWAACGSDREVSPWREVYEELIASNAVTPNLFPYLATRFVRRVITGPTSRQQQGSLLRGPDL